MNNLSVRTHAPHPGCFRPSRRRNLLRRGTFPKYIVCGAEVMVVSATRGEAGQIRSPHVAMRHTLGAVREQVLPQACKRLGVQRVVCLDHQDGALENVDREELTGQVVEHIRSFRPHEEKSNESRSLHL